MVTILCFIIPITALVVGFLVLKAVQLGLRWQVEVKQEQPPSMHVPEISNPIAPVFEAKQEREAQNIVSEWLNGPDERR